jgi:hypothetical protein
LNLFEKIMYNVCLLKEFSRDFSDRFAGEYGDLGVVKSV